MTPCTSAAPFSEWKQRAICIEDDRWGWPLPVGTYSIWRKGLAWWFGPGSERRAWPALDDATAPPAPRALLLEPVRDGEQADVIRWTEPRHG